MTWSLLLGRRGLALAVAAALAGSLIVGLLLTKGGPSSAGAADHLEAPGLAPPGGDKRLDITDIYAFKRGKNTVLVMNVNALSVKGSQETFGSWAPSVRKNKRVAYYFRIDNNGDGQADVNIRTVFGAAHNGTQTMQVWRNGKLLVSGRTSEFGKVRINRKGGVKAYAGMRDDPFFLDLNGFINILDIGGDSFVGCTGKGPDAFAGTNVSAIVLELPSKMLTRKGSSSIGIWASTERGKRQIDRMGFPAITTVFIPNNPFETTEKPRKNGYNRSKPETDVKKFTGELVDSLTTLFSLNDTGGALGGTDDPSDDAGQVAGLAASLLPDILPFDTSSNAGFLNGRKLADDVIDAELGLITEGFVTTDCVGKNDKKFRRTFPYLAGPHA